jgi:tetratricopeptide (TPR) repeat protein
MRILLIGALALSCLACSAPAARTATPYGEVRFENSGAPAAQAAFSRGMALLHDFEYGEAAAAFREAQSADPGFAMAYWGEAMTYNHPVWHEQDAVAGRAALAKLGPTPEARAAKARTEREKAYLAAAEVLYGEGSKEARDLRLLDAMAEIHRRWPDDEDAAAFHGLALLGSANRGRDIPTYMRAAAVLEEALPAAPEHPGLLHYLIHSYDDPAHAPLGMRAARIYNKVAPEAPHALHMTSHIFIARGMWDEVIAANEQAMRAGSAREAKHGRPALVCGHAPEWRVYALLQARRPEAREAIAACGRHALVALDKDPGAKDHHYRSGAVSYAGMLVREAIETGRPVDPGAFPRKAGAYPGIDFEIAYADALAAARRGDVAGLAAAQKRMTASGASGEDERVMAGQVEGLAMIRAGRTEPGLARLREVAVNEAAAPFEFGPPDVPKPTAELLGEELARLGRPREAAAAFREALARAPGRTLSLQGLATAQERDGDRDGARLTRAQLAKYVPG